MSLLSESTKVWPVYTCPSCDGEVLNAFGEQQCDSCRESTINRWQEEIIEAPNETWVTKIISSEDDMDEMWIHKSELGAKMRLLKELASILDSWGAMDDVPELYYNMYFVRAADFGTFIEDAERVRDGVVSMFKPGSAEVLSIVDVRNVIRQLMDTTDLFVSVTKVEIGE